MGPFQVFAVLLIGGAAIIAFFVWYGDWKETKKTANSWRRWDDNSRMSGYSMMYKSRQDWTRCN